MSLKLNSTNGSINIIPEDGVGNKDLTLPREGFLGDSTYQWVKMNDGNPENDRQIDVVYTNTTGKPIMVAAVMTNSTTTGWIECSIYIDDKRIIVTSDTSTSGKYARAGCVAIVPNNSTYKASAQGTNIVLYDWNELI